MRTTRPLPERFIPDLSLGRFDHPETFRIQVSGFWFPSMADCLGCGNVLPTLPFFFLLFPMKKKEKLEFYLIHDLCVDFNLLISSAILPNQVLLPFHFCLLTVFRHALCSMHFASVAIDHPDNVIPNFRFDGSGLPTGSNLVVDFSFTSLPTLVDSHALGITLYITEHFTLH